LNMSIFFCYLFKPCLSLSVLSFQNQYLAAHLGIDLNNLTALFLLLS